MVATNQFLLKNLLLLTAVCITSFGFSQSKSVQVKYITETITLDGILNESVWSQVEPATDFLELLPNRLYKSQAAS